MSNNIERLNYYEREYLRRFDFIAEQNYHMEMRRRLNLALHLWGIVQGLDVKQGEIVPGASNQFYISPGMAIDAYGREIFLFVPYVLSEDDLRANRITKPDRYSLWIAYDQQQSVPPAPGYRVCDLPNQYTRWRESFSIKLLPEDAKENDEPLLTDDWSDDPKKTPWPVRLGSVNVEEPNQELLITNAWPKKRVYIGIRAQHIVAPVATLGEGAPDANRPIKVEADLRAAKNLIVGKDFNVTKVKPASTESPFPGETGNLKVKHDIFLHGKLYAKSGNEFLELQLQIQRLMPEIKVGAEPIPIKANGDPSSDVHKIKVPSSLPSVTDAVMMVAISKIDWLDLTTFAKVPATKPLQLAVVAGKPASLSDPSKIEFPVTWTIGPSTPLLSNQLFVSSLTVSYIAIFYP